MYYVFLSKSASNLLDRKLMMTECKRGEWSAGNRSKGMGLGSRARLRFVGRHWRSCSEVEVSSGRWIVWVFRSHGLKGCGGSGKWRKSLGFRVCLRKGYSGFCICCFERMLNMFWP